MSRRPFTMEFILHDPPEYRDGFIDEIYAGEFRVAQAAREREVDAKIAMGWGATEACDIPANWREVRGPDSEGRRAAKQAVMRAIRARERARKEVSR